MASCLSKPVFCASFAEKELEETTTDIPLTAHSSLQLALVEMEMGNQSLASGKTIMPIEMVRHFQESPSFWHQSSKGTL